MQIQFNAAIMIFEFHHVIPVAVFTWPLHNKLC